ncbi:hypothetical protein MS3_00009527 [Schistosoma haematobium]|uniref:Uncharacterized protein n=1 Tax=Schistosoma haematobium TaxID=6185 RepID=A0A922IHI8_SCHHA|nr:hypothetical protein MS3_00009527 [Schistosoma haematobium]KAH9579344.1 hypothetical protein MS3_00009527 [Schistosoma haematobium]
MLNFHQWTTRSNPLVIEFKTFSFIFNSSEFLSIKFHLVSYPKCHQTSKDDNILQVNELPNEDESNFLKKLIEQDIQDWIKRFPELNSMFSIENERNEEITSTLDDRNQNNPLLNLNNAPIEESKKYQNEILSVCRFKF